MRIVVDRDSFTEQTSVGKLYIDDRYFCETLEDAARAAGIKIAGKTCLPAGNYWITATPSKRFGKVMPLIFTNKSTLACENEGIIFTGVRTHGGNVAADTDACLLVASHRDNPDRISGSVSDALREIIISEVAARGPIPLLIKNSPRA